jgi:hypothetical protein
LAKALLRDEPAAWGPVKDKVEGCLTGLRDRRPEEWAAVATNIVRLIDELDPEFRLNALPVLARFPGLLDRLEPATVTVIEQSIVNFDAGQRDDLSFFRAIKLEQFQPALQRLLEGLEHDEFVRIVQSAPDREFWPSALEHYSQAGSFRGAEAYFRELIAPFQATVGSADLNALFEVIPRNGQIYDAAGTSELVLEFLRGAAPRATPSFAARTGLYNALIAISPHVCGSYQDLWEYLAEDGWEQPEDN